MSKPPSSRLPTPELAELPQNISERIAAVQEKSGFVPNVFLALARRPEEFRAFFAYHDALMEKPGGLSKAEREMIVVATSGVNQCQYCVVAHGAILRIRAKNPLIADQVAINYRKADLEPRQKAMLDFAVKVAERSHAIDDADYEALKLGTDPEKIVKETESLMLDRIRYNAMARALNPYGDGQAAERINNFLNSVLL